MSALVLAAYFGGLLRTFELGTVDQRFSIRGALGPPEDIVVVKIDDVTFNDLQLRWPFPRSLHGKVIARLAKDGAAAIAFDVQFTAPTEPKEDNALLQIGRAHV